MKHVLIMGLGLVLLSGCARTGSTSTEQAPDSSAAPAMAEAAPGPADSTLTKPTPAHVPEDGKPPVPSDIQEAPDPKPMDWAPFDAYFRELVRVYEKVLVGPVEAGDLSTLKELAKSLAEDRSEKHVKSDLPRRQLLDELDRLLDKSTASMTEEQRTDVFKHIVQLTMEVTATEAGDQAPFYFDKINTMVMKLDVRIAQLRGYK